MRGHCTVRVSSHAVASAITRSGFKKKRLLWGSFLDSLAQQHLQFLTLPLVFKCKMSSLRLPYVVSRHQLYLWQQFQNALQLWRFLSYFTDSPGFITTHSISRVINREKGHSVFTWLLTSAPILPVCTDIRGAAASLVDFRCQSQKGNSTLIGAVSHKSAGQTSVGYRGCFILVIKKRPQCSETTAFIIRPPDTSVEQLDLHAGLSSLCINSTLSHAFNSVISWLFISFLLRHSWWWWTKLTKLNHIRTVSLESFLSTCIQSLSAWQRQTSHRSCPLSLEIDGVMVERCAKLSWFSCLPCVAVCSRGSPLQRTLSTRSPLCFCLL